MVLAAAVVLTTCAPKARAQIMTDNEVAFSVERFVPPPGPGGFLGAQDAEVLSHLAWSIGASASLMRKPIVLHDLQTGAVATTPVDLRLGFDLLAAVGLGSRFQVGVGLPVIAAQSGDRLVDTDLDDTLLAPIALGDARLHAKMRAHGRPNGFGPSAAIALAVSLPTGNEQHFAGEKGATIETRLIGAYREPRWGAAINLGTRIRTQEVILLSPSRPHGNELVGALAAEAVIPLLAVDHLSALAEWAFVYGDSRESSRVRGPSPQEWRLGLRWRYAPGTTLTGALGFGSTPDEVGSPTWRALAMVRFQSNRNTSDLDRDGIADRTDRCPHQPEDRDGFEDADGCPDLDNDGDRVPDEDDQCPNRAEVYNGHRDLDGCPDSVPAPL